MWFDVSFHFLKKPDLLSVLHLTVNLACVELERIKIIFFDAQHAAIIEI
jgi:hypothetical protein